LREGAKLAQFCSAEVFLLAVVDISSGSVTLEGGFAIPVEEQIATYKAILAEGVERLKAIGFSPTARRVWEPPDRRSLGSPKRSEQTS
jgi:hypothetical protein